ALRKMRQFGAIKSMPMRDYVVATSVGIVDGASMVDLCYDEDSRADVDMNVVMTGTGRFIELQATAERGSFDDNQLAALIALARVGLERLAKIQRATDEENNRLLIERLRGLSNRSARYVCVIALAKAGKALKMFRGEVAGRIIDEPRGANGFGYDPHFFYEPFGLTFAEAAPEQKLLVSHRGRALAEMLEYLRK